MSKNNLKTIYLGGGCFWCTEASFGIMDGVKEVINGYAGGIKENPTYEEVCAGSTGHAEVSKIIYDPSAVSLEKILSIFFAMHDPTSLNRQGNDIGTQYRSIILWADKSQEKEIKNFIKKTQKDYSRQIVTETTQIKKFWPAEEYHQKYFEKNPNAAYCRFVITPKIKKIRKKFL